MSVPIRHTIPPVALIATTVAVVLGLVLLGWTGGELHYRNCLSKVQLEQGSPPPRLPSLDNKFGIGGTTNSGTAKRKAAISDCSRLPF